jgi:hypothetical protein
MSPDQQWTNSGAVARSTGKGREERGRERISTKSKTLDRWSAENIKEVGECIEKF